MRHRALALLPLPLLLTLACRQTRPPETPTGPHVRILTYNVNYGAPAPERALDAITGSGADLVFLQETTPAWEARIRDSLGDLYPHMAFRHSRGAGGLAFLSKRPFSIARFLEPTVGWFPACIALAETPIGKIQVLNVHLRPPVSGGGGLASDAAAYVSTRSVRLQEIREFYEHLDPSLPAVLAGDFNEEDGGRALAWLKARPMTDALEAFDLRTDTWRWKTSYGTLAARLDHILYSPPLHALSARVLREGASDHFPVLAVLEQTGSP